MIRPGVLCLIVQGPYSVGRWRAFSHLIGRTCSIRSSEITCRRCVDLRCHVVAVAGEPTAMIIASRCLVPLTPPRVDIDIPTLTDVPELERNIA